MYFYVPEVHLDKNIILLKDSYYVRSCVRGLQRNRTNKYLHLLLSLSLYISIFISISWERERETFILRSGSYQVWNLRCKLAGWQAGISGRSHVAVLRRKAFCSLDPLIVNTANPGIKFTTILFAKQTDCLLVGDSDGQVSVYELRNMPTALESGRADIIDTLLGSKSNQPA